MSELTDFLLKADSEERLRLLRETPWSDLAVSVAELGQRREAAAAEVLALVDAVVEDRAVRKAARRELHRLEGVGVPRPAPPQVSPTAASALPEGPSTAHHSAWVSDIDATGDRALWMIGDLPLGGALLGTAILSEVNGLMEIAVTETTRKRFARTFAESASKPGSIVDIPGQYALELVKEGLKIRESSGAPGVPHYARFRNAFGEAPAPVQRALIYDSVSPVEVKFHPEWAEQASALFDEPELDGWRIPLPPDTRDRARELATTLRRQVVLAMDTPEEQTARWLTSLVEDSFMPAVRRGIQRRFEETAYVLLKTERLRQARLAVAAALVMSEPASEASRDIEEVLLLESLSETLAADEVDGEPVLDILAPYVEEVIAERPAQATRTTSSGLIIPSR